jgi:hypothetical protein
LVALELLFGHFIGIVQQIGVPSDGQFVKLVSTFLANRELGIPNHEVAR